MDQSAIPPPVSPSFPRLWIYLIVGGGLVIIGAELYLLFTSPRAASPGTKNKTPQLAVQQTNIAPDKLPNQFPRELVALEGGAKPTQNYYASTPDGRFQATRAYETPLELAESFAEYKKYFLAHGWTINNEVDNATSKIILASMGNLSVQVNISENNLTKIHSVEVSVTALPPSQKAVPNLKK